MSLTTSDQLSLPRDPTAALEAATKQYVDSAAPSPDYISGLKLSYVDATHVQVGTGAYASPSTGNLVRASNPVTTIVPATTNGFWHVYARPSSGNVAVVSSTTAPSAPYFGTARGTSIYPDYRYIGSVLVVSGAVVPFTMIGAKMRYLTLPMVAPFRVLSAGTALTSTTVDLSGVLPSTARIAHARVLNTATAGQVYIGNPDMGAASSSNYMTTARTGTETEAELLTDSSQLINYIYNASPGTGCNIDVNGYEFER
jgi:hypothetical protein